MNRKVWLCGLLVALSPLVSAATAEPPATAEFGRCMDRAAGVTVSMVDCIDAEAKRQDVLLNANYKQAVKRLSAQRQQSLLKAQRAWLAFRDAQCSFEYDPEGGTMAHVISADCFRSMTARRAEFLGTIEQ